MNAINTAKNGFVHFHANYVFKLLLMVSLAGYLLFDTRL